MTGLHFPAGHNMGRSQTERREEGGEGGGDVASQAWLLPPRGASPSPGWTPRPWFHQFFCTQKTTFSSSLSLPITAVGLWHQSLREGGAGGGGARGPLKAWSIYPPGSLLGFAVGRAWGLTLRKCLGFTPFHHDPTSCLTPPATPRGSHPPAPCPQFLSGAPIPRPMSYPPGDNGPLFLY